MGSKGVFREGENLMVVKVSKDVLSKGKNFGVVTVGKGVFRKDKNLVVSKGKHFFGGKYIFMEGEP